MSDEELNVESPLPKNKENWLDIDDSTSLPSISLDEALLQLDQLDDTLILGLPGTAEEESILDGGAASFSGHSHQHHKEPSTPIRYTINCPIAWRKVESISHQITNSEQKIGRPKAVASNGNRLAVITSKGALLIFEESTERLLRLTFGNSELGAAACVTFSDDGSHIAIGYSKGGVKIVNASSGSTIATIHEAGQGGKGVLQIIFLTRQKTILVLDSGGSVFEIRVRKNLTGKSKEQVVCVFSGCNGEVVLMRYVRPHQILILVTLTKILIVSTNHGGSVMNSIPLQGPPNVPPLCDFFVSQDSKIVKLCAIRGRHLSLYHLFPRRFQQKRGRFAELISTIEVPLDLLGLSFLSEAFIWGVDSKEQVGVIDLNNKGWLPLSSTQTPLQLVYATSDFKGLATGANVSAALCCLAETVCYPAITAQNGIVFVLGVFLYRFKILNELEIIESFQERKDFGSAALYSLDLAKGKFHSQMQNVQAKVKGRMAGILSNLLDWTLDGMPNGKVSDLVVHYKKNIEILLRVCHQGDYMPFFYTRAYPRLEADSLARAVMFDLLDEAVLDGALVDPPPTLVADYLINLLHEGHFSQLQAATMRLPIYSIDIHWVMSTCRQNQLYDGIIHISNKALFDFIGPLEEMFANIAEFSDRDLRSDSEIEIGNKLLLYLHCCLAGRAYPFGELPSHLVDTVPIEVFRCVTSLHGKDGLTSQERYPYLRQLLKFDAQQFFHVICTCADAKIFTTECRLQRLLDILCTICVETSNERTLSQLVQCVSHLAIHVRLLPQGPLLEDVTYLFLCSQTHPIWRTQFFKFLHHSARNLKNQVINTLLLTPNLSENSEMSVVELFRSMPDLSLQRPLQLAQRNPIKTKICTYILITERRFIELIKCFFENAIAAREVFSLISQILQLNLSPIEFKEVNEYLKENIMALTLLSPKETSLLVIDHFPSYLSSIRPIPGFSIDDSLKHFPLLRESFGIRKDRNEHFLTGDDELDEELFTITFHGFVHFSKSEADKKDLDEILTEFLQYWLPFGSKTDRCLNIASSAELTETCVLLLESRGFHERAFHLLKEKLIDETSKGEFDEEKLLSSIDRCVQFSVSHRDEAQNGGWMSSLFEHVITLNQNVNNNTNLGIRSRLLSITHKLLESDTTLAYQLLSALYEAPFFAQAKLEEHTDLLKSILMACSYEESILTSIHHCQNEEIGESLFKLSKLGTKRSTRVAGGGCVRCKGIIDKAAYVFHCGHVMHMECDLNGTRTCQCENPGVSTYPSTPRSSSHSNSKRIVKRDIFSKWDDTTLDCSPRRKN